MTRKLSRLTLVALFAVGLTGAPGPVVSNPGPIPQIICAPTHEMGTRLETQFGAQRAWQGLRSPEEIMELWQDERGEWTLVISYANGNRCIVAMGTGLTGFSRIPQG